MFVNWSDEKHAIGIPDIDAQHRELFLITNRLWEDHEKPDQQTLLRPLLKRLYAYTRYHFSTEEGMFRHYGYEAIAPHLHIHTGFTDRIRTYLQETRDGRAVNYNEILDTMVNWILFHIAGEDQKYAAWFLSLIHISQGIVR